MDRQTPRIGSRTIGSFCEEISVPTETVLVWLRRTYKDRTWSKHDVCTEAVLASPAIEKARGLVKEKPTAKEVAPQITESVPQTKANGWDFKALSFQAVCVCIVLGHAALIWYHAWFLWGTGAAIAGGISFFTVLGSLIICSDPRQQSVSQDSMLLIFLIDAAATVVHYKAFWISIAYKGGMGVERLETMFFAAFTSLFSAAGLYFYRASQIKEPAK